MGIDLQAFKFVKNLRLGDFKPVIQAFSLPTALSLLGSYGIIRVFNGNYRAYMQIGIHETTTKQMAKSDKESNTKLLIGAYKRVRATGSCISTITTEKLLTNSISCLIGHA